MRRPARGRSPAGHDLGPHQRRLSLAFVAAPAYLAARAPPEAPDDLGRHCCLCYRYTSSGTIHVWEFAKDEHRFARTVPGSFVTNDVDLMRDAAVSALGVACLPRPCVDRQIESGALVEVLCGWAPVLPPNQLYYPSRRQPTAAFRAFVEALRI
ncbi:hypothetical protein DA075_02455 [Methylobacterium currus]|uniref:LysR substrate-binding domain-containing protein n=1 Tax=Methylobacterium currus TaxID=2051553 RepID=A0A2R4WEG5_9HYPH|nr:hypothetical protein DA075_02455 [Methylobacterium currus]